MNDIQRYTETYLYELQPGFTPVMQLLYFVNTHIAHHDEKIQSVIGDTLLLDGYSWVITQYRINIDCLPIQGESITVSTSLIEQNKFFVTRQTEIEQNGQRCIEIFTQYATIHLAQRRMGRLKEIEQPERYLVDGKEPDFIKFPRGVELTQTPIEVSIEPHDIDMNHHVNNLVYFKWGTNILPSELKMDDVQTISIKYEKEILPEDHVGVFLHHHDDSEAMVVIYNLSKDVVACMIIYEFKK